MNFLQKLLGKILKFVKDIINLHIIYARRKGRAMLQCV